MNAGRKPWIPALILIVAVAGCLGAWSVHRPGELEEERRREEIRRAKESAKVAVGLAALNRDWARVDQLLTENPDLPVDLPFMLESAAYRGDTRLAEVLLDRGCNPDGAPGREFLLSTAASMGHRSTIELLLRRGAHADRISADGPPPLHSAVYGNQVRIARMLLRAGSEIDAQVVMDGPYPGKHRRRLLDNDVKIVMATSGGGRMGGSTFKPPPRKDVSPIMLAAWLDEPEMVRLLLEYQPNLELKTEQGETALDLARKEGNQEVVRVLSRAARGVKRERAWADD
jgi:hypothetical protein